MSTDSEDPLAFLTAEPEKSIGCPKDALHHVPENQSSEPVRPVKKLKLVGLVLLGLAWLGLWTYMFFATEAHAVADFDRRMAMIERREVQPRTLYVVEIIHNRRREDPEWTLWFREKGDKRTTHRVSASARWDDNIDDLHVGSPVTAYRFNDARGCVFPRFEHDPREGLWFIVGIAFLPVLVGGGVLLFKTLRG
jgi:hypothetical protein